MGLMNIDNQLRVGQTSVNVCVTVHSPRNSDCPIQFPFDLRFLLVNNTPGRVLLTQAFTVSFASFLPFYCFL